MIVFEESERYQAAIKELELEKKVLLMGLRVLVNEANDTPTMQTVGGLDYYSKELERVQTEMDKEGLKHLRYFE